MSAAIEPRNMPRRRTDFLARWIRPRCAVFGVNVPKGNAVNLFSVDVSPVVVARNWVANIDTFCALEVAVHTCKRRNYLYLLVNIMAKATEWPFIRVIPVETQLYADSSLEIFA